MSSFWLDESAQALESSRPLSEQHLIKEDFQPPLFHYIIHGMTRISREEWVLRLPSLLAGILTIGLLYRLAQEHSDPKGAWIAPFLLAISPMHVYLSQELRPYAMSGLFVTLSWYLLRSRKKPDLWRWIAFTFTTTAGLYTLYIYPFFILGQFLYVLFENRKVVWHFFISLIVSGICFLPWMPFFLGQLSVGTSLTVSLPGWSQVVATPQVKALPLAILKLVTGQVYLRDSSVVTTVAGAVSLFWVFVVAWCSRRKEMRYILYWVVLPLLATWIFSFVIPVIAPKRLIGILPGIVLALTYFFVNLQGKWGAKILLVGLTGLTIVQLFFIGLYWTVEKYQREPWREVISVMQSRGPAGSIALFAFSAQFAPWDWYSDGSIRPWSTGSVHITSASALDERLAPVIQNQRVYLFSYLSDLTDPKHLTAEWLAQRNWKQVDQIDGGPLGFIFVFDRMNSP